MSEDVRRYWVPEFLMRGADTLFVKSVARAEFVRAVHYDAMKARAEAAEAASPLTKVLCSNNHYRYLYKSDVHYECQRCRAERAESEVSRLRAMLDAPPAQMSWSGELIPITNDGMRTVIDAHSRLRATVERVRAIPAECCGTVKMVHKHQIDAALAEPTLPATPNVPVFIRTNSRWISSTVNERGTRGHDARGRRHFDGAGGVEYWEHDRRSNTARRKP